MVEGLCIYCSTEPATTVDHVPPRSFFGTPPPLDLITVPACQGCNGGFNVDDDYVRLVLAIDEKAKGMAERDQIIPKIQRYAQRRENKRSLVEFYDSLGTGWHTSSNGIVVWSQHHTVDGKRMDAFARRIVQGLFYRAKGYRLPDGFVVQAVHRTRIPGQLQSPQYGDFSQFILGKLMDADTYTARGEVFAYSWVQSPNGPDLTWWLLEFYGTVEWMCSTWNPAAGGAAPMPSD